MPYLAVKKIKGRHYGYVQESYREGGKVRTRTVEYLGAIDPTVAEQVRATRRQLGQMDIAALVQSVREATALTATLDQMDGDRVADGATLVLAPDASPETEPVKPSPPPAKESLEVVAEGGPPPHTVPTWGAEERKPVNTTGRQPPKTVPPPVSANL